jgi:hypothetical protein
MKQLEQRVKRLFRHGICRDCTIKPYREKAIRVSSEG